MKLYYKLVIKKDERAIEREVEMQNIANKYGFSPKIVDFKMEYDKINYEYRGDITMENLDELCIADKYGDDPANIPKLIWDQIRTILKILYDEEGIEYIDITGYNFIEKNNKVYIIDFGDAIYSKKDKDINWFLNDFLNGTNSWNPDFK